MVGNATMGEERYDQSRLGKYDNKLCLCQIDSLTNPETAKQSHGIDADKKKINIKFKQRSQ